MFGNPTEGKCRQGIGNVDAQHDILHAESFDPFETYSSELVNDKNVLKDYENDKTSKRNFYLIANNIPDKKLGDVDSRKASEVSETSGLSEKPDSIKLDSIRSGESLIKHFNFDTSKYNSVTNKCIEFWRTLMQTDLQPIKCTLLKGSRSSITLEGEQEEETNDNCMWYQALVELQRRKLDEAAFAAIAQQCKLCDQDDPYSAFKQKQGNKYSKDELEDSEDLTCLNYWNPKEKQVAEKKTPNTQQQKNENSKALVIEEDELPTLTVDAEEETSDEEETPHPTEETPEEPEEDNAEDKQERGREEETCGTHLHEHAMKMSHSDPCECGRASCSCADDGDAFSDQLHSVQISQSEPCECGRAQCACNPCKDSSHEAESLNLSFECKLSAESDDKESTKQESEEQKQLAEEDKNEENGILPKCEICKTYCKCWEHKIEMCKHFIDESKFQLKYQELKQDKSCETEAEEEKEEIKIEEKKQFCIICGHHDCDCKGPPHKETRKYIEYFEFDDHSVTTLLLKKDKSLQGVKSLTMAEKISRSALQKKIYDHSKEHVCCVDQNEKLPSVNKEEKVEKVSKVISPKKSPKKKLLITPEQRAKDITNQNRVTLELDKYGIPQLVRYADGRLAPKPTTSQDILSSNNSEHALR